MQYAGIKTTKFCNRLGRFCRELKKRLVNLHSLMKKFNVEIHLQDKTHEMSTQHRDDQQTSAAQADVIVEKVSTARACTVDTASIDVMLCQCECGSGATVEILCNMCEQLLCQRCAANNHGKHNESLSLVEVAANRCEEHLMHQVCLHITHHVTLVVCHCFFLHLPSGSCCAKSNRKKHLNLKFLEL